MELLQDDEAVPGEEEAVSGDVQPDPGVARPSAGLLTEVPADLADSSNLLQRGKQHGGEEIPDRGAEDEPEPDEAGVWSEQVSLQTR